MIKTNFLFIKIPPVILGFVFIFAFSAAFLSQTNGQAEAAQIKKSLCGGSELKVGSEDCKAGSFNGAGKCIENGTNNVIDSKYCSKGRLNNLISNIVNILSVIVGIVAVVMIIIGGFKYITSGGDSGNVSSAKNTILYAIVGLVIVALAQAIVRFVLSKAT